MEKGKLTLKQQNFANNYLITGNATEAANRVYKPKNRNTAHAIGAENLQKPAIKSFIESNIEKNGLNTKLVIQSLVEDIKNKPSNRVNELLLASKLLGLIDRVKQEQNTGQRLPVPIFRGLSVVPELIEKYNL